VCGITSKQGGRSQQQVGVILGHRCKQPYVWLQVYIYQNRGGYGWSCVIWRCLKSES
jgi:hypothetical protein